MPEQKPNAFATLVTNDGYVEPAIVLASTLRRLHHSGTAELVVFVAQGALSASSLATLGGFFDQVIPVLPIRTGPRDRYTLDEVLGRSDLHSALTKIRLFDPAVTGRWKTIVYLDADTVPLQPIAELFGALGQPSDPHRVHLAAAPDAGWPDAFNSGVLVLRADADVYNGLVERLERDGSFDGADQGLLNTYFSSFSASGTALPLTPPASTSTPGLSPLATPTSEADHLGSQTQSEPKAVRLPFAYNVTASASYTYAPAFGHYGPDIRILHYAGPLKPWMLRRGAGGEVLLPHGMESTPLKNMMQRWWDARDAVDWRVWARTGEPSASPSFSLSLSTSSPSSFTPPNLETPILTRAPTVIVSPPTTDAPGSAIPTRPFVPAESWMAVASGISRRGEKGKGPEQPNITTGKPPWARDSDSSTYSNTLGYDSPPAKSGTSKSISQAPPLRQSLVTPPRWPSYAPPIDTRGPTTTASSSASSLSTERPVWAPAVYIPQAGPFGLPGLPMAKPSASAESSKLRGGSGVLKEFGGDPFGLRHTTVQPANGTETADLGATRSGPPEPTHSAAGSVSLGSTLKQPLLPSPPRPSARTSPGALPLPAPSSDHTPPLLTPASRSSSRTSSPTTPGATIPTPAFSPAERFMVLPPAAVTGEIESVLLKRPGSPKSPRNSGGYVGAARSGVWPGNPPPLVYGWSEKGLDVLESKVEHASLGEGQLDNADERKDTGADVIHNAKMGKGGAEEVGGRDPAAEAA